MKSKFESELTRRYLLNSHSREGLDEVVQDHEDVEFGSEDEIEGSNESMENEVFLNGEGQKKTRDLYRESYE
ncbi:hypothetical protein J2Z69_001905 [Paenibacillus shirakamiensis]|uniref:Uncharacterized protein n=1 Tax=Paenibacillus shirakamiensis TaxID=1265935 RepID=A0ABS4JGN0_9BACL|nr:hypothetical protein [Paenibacillus shirakamiensis]MBP2000874.1 hypothetical protein [Paenibacillus shirakamiensis]